LSLPPSLSFPALLSHCSCLPYVGLASFFYVFIVLFCIVSLRSFLFPSFLNRFFSFFFLSSCYSLIFFRGIFCYNDLNSRGFLRVSWQIVKEFSSQQGETF
jgi:hypothetical protein